MLPLWMKPATNYKKLRIPCPMLLPKSRNLFPKLQRRLSKSRNLKHLAFANAKFDGDKIIVVPNGEVNDSTFIYEDKTLGGLCDYIDSTVLEEGRTINRDFLYDLISVEVIDPQLYQDYDSFSRTLYMSLSIANEFSTIDVDLKDMILDTTDQAKQVFEVNAEGKDTTWILDGHEYKFYLNDGSTEYTSSMFDPETLAVWSVVLDQYFEVEE